MANGLIEELAESECLALLKTPPLRSRGFRATG
jgi:hypothetical protein